MFGAVEQVSIPSTAAFIETTGLYDVNYRIVIACRNGRIYTIKVIFRWSLSNVCYFEQQFHIHR